MNKPLASFARGTVAAIGVGWMFVVALAYYVFHRPIDLATVLEFANVVSTSGSPRTWDLANAEAIANTLADAAVVGLLLITAAVLGRRALRAFHFESALEGLVIQTGFGLGLVGFAGFTLTIFGLAHPPVLWGVVAICLIVLHREGLALWRELRSIEIPCATRTERLLAVFLAVNLGIAFVFALSPPTGWDALAYHLSLPKAILALGSMPPPSENLPFQYPALVEMLFVFAMGLKSDAAAQGLHWAYFVLTLGLMLAFAGRYLEWRTGWLAAALLAAVPSVLLLSTYAYNDLALMFYVFAAVYWTQRAIETGQRRDFILAGLLAGMAIGEKYTAMIVPLVTGALVLFQDGAPTRRTLENGVILGVSALAAAMPWFARNAVAVGNPIYPFVRQGLYWDEFRAVWFSRFGTGLLNSPIELIAVPWTMVVQGIQGGVFDATVGPLLLALLPFSMLRGTPARSRPVRMLAMVAIVLFGFWLLGVAQSKLLWQTRFLFPAFPFFALLAAEGWTRLAQLDMSQFSVRRFAGLVIALALGLNLVSNLMVTVRNHQFDVLLGFETRQQFLERNLGAHYVAAEWINANLPENAHIVALWEPRGYYVERPIEPDAILDRLAHLQFLYGNADAIARHWREKGYTHVLLYREGLNAMLESGYDPVGDAEMDTLRALEEKHLRLVYGKARLGLTRAGGKPALTNAETEPYAVYELE